jgi:S-DNA-T family DNA segregation ATPase FtsK/SpoIIIE
MANTKKKNTSKGKPEEQLKPEQEQDFSMKKVVKDERTHKISGFVLILIALLLFMALASYCFTWQNDQDKVFKAGSNFLFADNISVDNMLGRLGAWTSHVLIYDGFGLAAFLFCTMPFIWGVNLIFGKRIFSISKNLRYAILGAIYFSVVMAFIASGSDFSFGGAVGEMIGDYLVKLIGKAGTGLVLLLVGAGWTIWRYNPTFKLPEKKVRPALEVAEDLQDAPFPEDPKAKSVTSKAKSKSADKEELQSFPVEVDEEFPNIGTGVSINELYANGQFNNLSANSLIDTSSPLDGQQVSGGGNSLNGDEGVTVIMPRQHPQQVDPMTAFNLSEEMIPETPLPPTQEKPKTKGKKEPPVVVPVPFEISIPNQDDDEEIGAQLFIDPRLQETEDEEDESSDISVILPEPVETEEEEPEVPAFKPMRREFDGPADIELEIRPSAERTRKSTNGESEEEEIDIQNLEPYDPELDLRDYKKPTLDLLELHGSEKIVTDPAELEDNKNQIINTLKNYDITIQRISATVGPTVTLYEIVPAPGVRISRIKNLEDDIALSLAALGIRIIAPIPGKGTIGIEVPNVRKSIVSMRTLLGGDKFQNSSFSLPIAIGKKIDNEHLVLDLAAMPHLLMAGATGQGKSVGLNAILVSLLYKKHPSQLKFVLVDPKKVELSVYKLIERHFLAKLPGEEEAIITDTKKVVNTLNALCIEMDNRYDLLKEASVRNIKEYNEKFTKRRLNPQKGHQYLPFIVLVVDEFADLIMTAGKEVEMPIARLAQLARAVGIHLIIATQRPSVNIITGTIKANFPGRIAFKVSSKIDSRTILDAGGADQLIGKGDMLVSHNGELIRVQCAFVDTPEVDRITDFIAAQRGYPDAFLLPEYVDEKDMEAKDFDLSDRDKLFADAARLIVQNQMGSTSLIQRRMKLGYNRAGRLMDQLEAAGIVGENKGSKARDVLVRSEDELNEILDRV